MQILALNSSPRNDDKSKTFLMLKHLTDGMRSTGADVELVNLRGKKIHRCTGCFGCLTKSPGQCMIKDDMSRELFPKWLGADMVIYATPLYHLTVSATLKAFIERTYPMIDSFIIHGPGGTYSQMRSAHPKVVLLSVSGYPEISEFEPLSAWANALFKDPKLAEPLLVGEIYRPMADALAVPIYKEKAVAIYDAAYQAGRELVENQKVAPETLALITQPVTEDIPGFYELVNLLRTTCIKERLTPHELRRQKIRLRPDSINTFIQVAIINFNGKPAPDINKRFQFNFSGEIQGSCYFDIKQGRIQGNIGASDEADLVINALFEDWMDLMAGKVTAQQLFEQRRARPTGDPGQLRYLFGRE